jgi:hypothetical protein
VVWVERLCCAPLVGALRPVRGRVVSEGSLRVRCVCGGGRVHNGRVSGALHLLPRSSTSTSLHATAPRQQKLTNKQAPSSPG